jgi:hypothetical protein
MNGIRVLRGEPGPRTTSYRHHRGSITAGKYLAAAGQWERLEGAGYWAFLRHRLDRLERWEFLRREFWRKRGYYVVDARDVWVSERLRLTSIGFIPTYLSPGEMDEAIPDENAVFCHPR